MSAHARLRFIRVTFAIALALLAASCGGDEAAVPKAERSGDTGEFAVYTAKSDGFSISVPRSWESISSDQLDRETIEKLVDRNPDMRPLVEVLFEPGSPIKLIAVDPRMTQGFRTNLNVVVQDAEPGATVDELSSPGNLERIEREEGAALQGPLESEVVDLPAGPAHKLSFQVEFTGPEGELISLYQQQYELISSRKYYGLVYTTVSDRRSELEAVFAESARSFRIG